jgi:two-component system, NtrC family, sensor histidine kinase HydH
VKLSLGLPELVARSALPRRLAFLTAGRLGFLTLSLGLIGLFYLRNTEIQAASLRVGLALLVASFFLTGIYALWLRVGRGIPLLADTQLVLDQAAWTVVAYLTGGAASGAVSFYGLSCLVGAALSGSRGAAVAAASGIASYSTLVLLIAAGTLQPPPDQVDLIYRLTPEEVRYHLALNALVQVVVALLAGTLAERLRWTGGELLLARERAEQAERMAALGRLATGLAHEIRNPLGSIAGSVGLLRSAPELTNEDRQLCDIIQRETNRLNDLVSDMVDLSRPRRPELATVDVASLAREVVELAGHSGRSVSDVRVEYSGPHAVPIVADGAQVRQLVWNLVRNGVQASEPGGVVSVVVEVGAGGPVLSVVDEGAGIDAAAKERLFDAFFTTRSHGTGVGLAVVKRIADEHGFDISVESDAGKGAAFRVSLGKAHEKMAGPKAGGA